MACNISGRINKLFTKYALVKANLFHLRAVFGITGTFDKYLQPDTLRDIENYWKPRLKDTLPKHDTSKQKYYVLSMFPYPSGKLHMGHVRVYSISDAFAHYYRMRGYNVIHPMGWDAFGLPAENAAIENNVSPEEWTTKNIKAMKSQLEELGCTFDWDREIATCDPEYYKWTQFFFIKLFKEGLAYQQDSIVNWDPIDQTVLADEQVDHQGKAWRSGAKVEKRPLRQWFFKTTSFSKSLLDGLEDPSLLNWRDILKAQKNWIGECSGTRIDFQLKVESTSNFHEVLTVWTDQPHLVFGAEFVAIHPDHILNKKYGAESDQTISLSEIKVVNPLTKETLPIYVTDSIQFAYGSKTKLGVPCFNELDAEFASSFGVHVTKNVTKISPTGELYLENSGPVSGLNLDEGKEKIMQILRNLGIGGFPVSSNLQDWLISRQRYWGTPIPVVHCPSCGCVPVRFEDLPVELPKLDATSIKGSSPLLNEDWRNTTCPSCSGPAKRETDTMDTFVDSSWYFLRYLDTHNRLEAFSPTAVKDMPVDLYIGGKEHAYLHLYYARFFTHFLNSIGLVPTKEPFSGLITQGMVKGKSYRVKNTTRYLKPEELGDVDGKVVEKSTGKIVVTEWDKMSKSKHNGVDPGSMIDKYGSDTVRMLMLSDVGPSSERNWSEDTYPGIRNMQIKLWKLVYLAADLQNRNLPELRTDTEMQEHRNKLREARNYYLKKANHNYNLTRNLAVVMAGIHGLIGASWIVPGQVKRDSPEYQQVIGTALILLAPIAPHFASELWAGFCSVPNRLCQDFEWNKGIFEQPWPEIDPLYNISLKVIANGKELANIPVAKWRFDTLTEEDAFELACHENLVQEQVLPYDIERQHFIKHESYEAILSLGFNNPDEDYRKMQRMAKEEKKKEKVLKKNRREARIKELAENEKRKSSRTISKH